MSATRSTSGRPQKNWSTSQLSLASLDAIEPNRRPNSTRRVETEQLPRSPDGIDGLSTPPGGLVAEAIVVAVIVGFPSEFEDRVDAMTQYLDFADAGEVLRQPPPDQPGLTVNELVKTVHENESIYIPIGAVHRLENSGKILLELIEVQTGSYLGEDDIIRIEDDYQRS